MNGTKQINSRYLLKKPTVREAFVKKKNNKMKKPFLLSVFLIVIAAGTISGQTFFTPEDNLINGYANKISGYDFDYHSCIPGLRESMLIRATNGTESMEWETDKVPDNPGKKKYATFIWIAALGSGSGNGLMTLEINNKNAISFQTDGRTQWSTESADGSSLTFHSVMKDQNDDLHGYMILRIPAGNIERGSRVRLKVTGGSSGLSAWYMTFRKQVRNEVSLNSFPAILKNNGNPLQLVEAAVFYFGDQTEAKVYQDNKFIKSATLRFGYNAIVIGVPVAKRPSTIDLKVVADGFTSEKSVIITPVKKWTVDFIQHSHTDIGYTRSQTEILAEHLRYIDYALDYCDATDNYPDEAQFRWTCEASWPVDEYLKVRPASQRERLLRRIKEGRIEVTGMYFNFNEIPDEHILTSSLDALKRIRAEGIDVTLAMQNDVNGIGWCMNDYFNTMGIRYLNMGTHGHRALICFDKPTMFWWESPSGNRILTFRAEHYMTGNTVMEIQSGDIDKFRNDLLNYLISLQGKGYQYDEMAIQYSGYLTDNSPPSTYASDLIKRWNEIFEWPKLTTSTTEHFFTVMEEKYGKTFPVIRGAWPDWWTDGFGASAREVATAREASVSLMAGMAGMSMARIEDMTLPEETVEQIALAQNALLFYTEHTTGYSESVREPFSKPTMEQRALKESYAWEANRRAASLGEATMGLLQSNFVSEKYPSMLVFNTLNWERSGLITVYIDHQIIPRGAMADVYDHDGNRLAAQPLSHRSDGTYWAFWVEKIPPFGFRKYIIKQHDYNPAEPSSPDSPVLENRWYHITADINKGTIKKMYDKELLIELADAGSEYEIGEFILEKLGNRSQMESKRLDDYIRLPLDTIWFDSVNYGEIWNSIRFYGESETSINPHGFMIEYRLFNTEKRVDIACSIVKKSIITPESFYIAFPFMIENGTHFTEVQGGVIETGRDQIKGSSNDWYTVQNFTAVRSNSAQIVLGCREMPLMQFGAINTGRYQAGAIPQTTHIFSWPMNNYWVTNFNAEQRGGHSWTYYLTSSSDISDNYASRFGWGARVPFLTRVLPGSGGGDERWQGSFITGWPGNVILISAIPTGDGGDILLHVRETGGLKTIMYLKNGITGKDIDIIAVDATGEEIAKSDNTIPPLGSAFFKIILNK